jgi:hypothetical protein
VFIFRKKRLAVSVESWEVKYAFEVVTWVQTGFWRIGILKISYCLGF